MEEALPGEFFKLKLPQYSNPLLGHALHREEAALLGNLHRYIPYHYFSHNAFVAIEGFVLERVGVFWVV